MEYNRDTPKRPLVSIVVPVYMVEDYLAQCVSSLCRQTYRNLEIILVDDGSPDRSGAYCDHAAETDSRIVVVHKSNGGLSDARNAGIERAAGKYIAFCDSDDWIEPDTIERALNGLLQYSADAVIWGFSSDTVDGKEAVLSTEAFRSFGLCGENDYLMLEAHPFCAMRGYAWNKLYRMDLIRRRALQFPKGISLVEDTVFNADYFSFCGKLLFMDFVGTHYMQRNRETLGTKYYPDYLALRDRNTEANVKLLRSFGAPEDYLRLFTVNADFITVQGYIRMIAKCGGLNRMEKKCEIGSLLNSRRTKETMQCYEPKSLKSRIYAFMINHRMKSVLLRLESSR